MQSQVHTNLRPSPRVKAVTCAHARKTLQEALVRDQVKRSTVATGAGPPPAVAHLCPGVAGRRATR